MKMFTITSRELFAVGAITTRGTQSGTTPAKNAAPADFTMKLRRESSLYSVQPQLACSSYEIMCRSLWR